MNWWLYIVVLGVTFALAFIGAAVSEWFYPTKDDDEE